MTEFDAFFARATGYRPHGYQARIARDGLPAVVEAPTGTGKTGIILAWLWRRLYAAPGSTPRRLVYALPQRSLVGQVAGEAAKWLANLGLADQVALHVVMGGAGESQRQWQLDMHKPAIVVGTVDSLVSKALNRGYGIGRASYPIDFALVTNGAHWVVDEIHLCPESTTTLRQLAAFARMWRTAEQFGLTCMSATVPGGLRPWAKSGTDKPLRFEGGVAFRHELASLLILAGPLDDLLAGAPDADLAKYLVLAHHGKLRVQVRDPGDLNVLAAGEASDHKRLGLEEGTTTEIPPLLGQPSTQLTVNLDQFRRGGERSWTRTVLRLCDRYGPFVLAYLETIVRVADWRASA